VSERPHRRLPEDGLRPEEVEGAIADLPFERAYLFDADGRQIARFQGDDARILIQLSSSESERLRGGRLIHNHPPDADVPPNDPRHDSASFSELDLRWAREHNLAAMIVVSPTWRHLMTRPEGGWHATLPSVAEFEDSLSLLYDDIAARDVVRVRSSEVSFEEAMATRSHRVNEQFSREIGAIYRRERR
jgi:hypothetical protein